MPTPIHKIKTSQQVVSLTHRNIGIEFIPHKGGHEGKAHVLGRGEKSVSIDGYPINAHSGNVKLEVIPGYFNHVIWPGELQLSIDRRVANCLLNVAYTKISCLKDHMTFALALRHIPLVYEVVMYVVV